MRCEIGNLDRQSEGSPRFTLMHELAGRALKRAARLSADGRSVALVFGTVDFAELLLNWACHALSLGVRWFLLVAMDTALLTRLRAVPHMRKHLVLLPRLREGNATITKLNIIGERQRFGLQALEHGYNVVHSDADALWIRDPFPLFAAADIVAERIWGKPLSVVKDWGAGICTGFYFLRSTPAVVALAQSVRTEVSKKRARQPSWQASDQYYVNVMLHRYGVRWEGGKTMAGSQSMETRYFDSNATVGTAHTLHGTIRILMLPHNVVPRACPMLSADEMKVLHQSRRNAVAYSDGRRQIQQLRGKPRYWQHLLQTAHVLHCFPPEKKTAERRHIFMGHPEHTSAELAFARRQGLWMLDERSGDTRCRIRSPDQ